MATDNATADHIHSWQWAVRKSASGKPSIDVYECARPGCDATQEVSTDE